MDLAMESDAQTLILIVASATAGSPLQAPDGRLTAEPTDGLVRLQQPIRQQAAATMAAGAVAAGGSFDS